MFFSSNYKYYEINIYDNDEELEKLSVSELQDLAVTNPPNVNQLVRILNRKAINRPLTTEVAPSEYEVNSRAIGPGSWFFEFMSEEPWYKYIKTRKDKNVK